MGQNKRRSSRHLRLSSSPRRASAHAGKNGGKTNSVAWYQHLSVVIPLGACVAFIVLLGGALAVKQIIVFVHGPTVRLLGGVGLSDSVDEDGEAADSDILGPSDPHEPQLEVLPPAAAKQPGRTLAKMLLVGPGANMFPSISDAVKAAIPGDIIEVRTNGPILEPGAELKRDDRLENAAITIRAGKDFQPVVRSGNPSYLLHVLNVDVVVTGLHYFASGQMVSAENCNATVTDCTFTDSKGVHIRNTAEGAAIKATFERCFLRTSRLASLEGPRVSLDVRECGVIGIMWPIGFKLDEEQSIDVQQCTFMDCYLLNVDGSPGKSPPAKPLAFRFNRSVGGLTHCCSSLICLNVPTEFLPVRTFEDAKRALKLSFLECDAKDSVWHYWESWGIVNDGGEKFQFYSESPFSPFTAIPLYDPTLKFGEEFEPGGQLHQQKGVLPKHLGVITSTGPLAELRARGIIVGCDVTKLPVPPPSTLVP